MATVAAGIRAPHGEEAAIILAELHLGRDGRLSPRALATIEQAINSAWQAYPIDLRGKTPSSYIHDVDGVLLKPWANYRGASIIPDDRQVGAA